MAQVKFYSVSELPENPDAAGLYFVANSELYKGATRFGANKVFTVSNADDLLANAAATAGKISGDVAVGYGAAKMWDGSAWQDLADGTLTSRVSALETKVSAIEGIVDASASSVTASTGTFGDLTVSGTATFSATTVSADTLTIGGSTVEQLADKQIAAIAASTVVSASNGITVSVTTQGGSVTAVALDASAFGNAMHFRNVVSNTADIADPVAGDIVVIGSNADTGFVAGQEYIYTNASTWEVIGDQNTYAINAYSSTATVYAGVTTLPGALNAAGAAIDALASKTDAYVGGSASDADKGVAVTVSVDASTLAPSVDVAVTAASTMAFGAAGDPSEIATTKAIADFYANSMVWLDASGQPVQNS